MSWSIPVAQNGDTVRTYTVLDTSPASTQLSAADSVDVSFVAGSPIKLLSVLRSLGPQGLSGPVFQVEVEVVGGSFTTLFIRGGILP